MQRNNAFISLQSPSQQQMNWIEQAANQNNMII